MERRRGHERCWWQLGLRLAVVALPLGACDVSQMAFVQDHRVEFVVPPDRDTVTLPVVLEWDVEGFRVTGRDGARGPDAGYFAIFVDRNPMPPGRSLEWLAEQDDSCGSAACGTVDRLADVYVTSDTRLELERLPADTRPGTLERHEAVLVLLDGSGARIGESAFYVRFLYDRATV